MAATALCMSAYSQKSFTIKGKVEVMTTDTITLYKIVNNKEIPWLKSKMTDGEFTFSGKIETTELCLIRLGNFKFPIKYFFLDKGITNYTCSYDREKNRPLVPTIEGTTTQNKLNSYENGKKEIYEKIIELNAKQHNASLTPNQVSQIESQKDSLYSQMNSYNEKCIIAYADCAVSPYIIKTEYLFSISFAKLKEYLNLYSQELKRMTIVKEIEEYGERLKRVDVGADAPNIRMTTLNGEEFELASLKGKVYLIDFWASWCGPCRKENPNMVKIYNDYHAKGLEMVGISLDKSIAPWKAAIEKDGLRWIHISDLKYWQSEAAQLYVISSVPNTVLVDKDGKIVARGLHGEELRKAIEKYL